MTSTGARLLALVAGIVVVVLAVIAVGDLAGPRSNLVCGAGTHRVQVRTPTYPYLADECRPGNP